jgi:malate dehydrogenase (decarboxylating)
MKNINQFAPIIYTPIIGLVCQQYSGLFSCPCGVHFTANDHGEVMSMIYNWPSEQVQLCDDICFHLTISIIDDC